MKIQIRQSVFETNSSSVHSITMCDSENFKKWKNDEMKFCANSETFLSNDAANIENSKKFEEDNISSIYEVPEYKLWKYYLSFDEFFNNYIGLYEYFESEYNGVVAFGYYGEDR